MDYWQHLEWEVVDDWQALCRQLPKEKHWYFSKKAAGSYTKVKYSSDDVLVFGPESLGLPEQLLAISPERSLRIPTRNAVRSLNLSNSVAVACYEAIRQDGGFEGDERPLE